MQPPSFSFAATGCLPVYLSHHLSGMEWGSGSREELEADLYKVMGDVLLPGFDLQGLFGDQS